MGYLPPAGGGSAWWPALLSLGAGVGFAFGSSSIVINYVALSPVYSTSLFAVGSAIANTGSALGPVFVGHIITFTTNDHDSPSLPWRHVNVFLAGILLVAFVGNAIFGEALPVPELNQPSGEEESG